MLITVGPRGQITIPKAFRKQLGIEPGDKITVTNTEEGLLLKPVTVTIFDLKGSIPIQSDGPYSLEQIREQVGEYLSQRASGKLIASGCVLRDLSASSGV